MKNRINLIIIWLIVFISIIGIDLYFSLNIAKLLKSDPMFNKIEILLIIKSILIFFILFIYSFIFFFQVKNIYKPIDFIIKALKQLSEGNFDISVPSFSKIDKLQLLCSNFNQTLVSLKKMNKEKQELMNKKIIDEKFQEMGKLTGIIMHEIINPLNSLMLILESIPVENKEVKQKISRSIDDLNQVLARITKLREIFSENIYNKKRSSLDSFIKKFFNSIEKGNIKINFNFPVNYHIMFNFDSEKLSYCLENLFNNSKDAKATCINISIEEKNNFIILTYKDNGAGLKKPINENEIFKPFFSTKKSLGLGLFLTKKIITDHSGNLGLMPVKKGCGFIIKFEK